jgi:hypothetical protein
MRVFDCFPFFNELDLLELRLHELKDVVDIFVLVESTLTTKGQSKPLYFDDSKQRFRPFLDKIRHVIVSDLPEHGSAWDRERSHKLAMTRGLGDVRADDVVIVADADEIVHPSVVGQLGGFHGITKLRMRMYMYYMNMFLDDDWDKPFALPGSLIDQIDDVNRIRSRNKKPDSFPADCRWRFLDSAGWHFTHVGGADRVREKLLAYAHKGGKYDDLLAEGGIEERILTGRVPGGLRPLHLVRIDESMPRYVRDNEEHFSDLGYLKDPWERVAELESLTEQDLQRVAESTQRLLSEQLTVAKRLKKENEKLRLQLAARG